MTMYIKDTLKASISGNAATATTLANARTITVGSTGKTFDGSGNVSWSLSEIGAAPTSHTHSYLPLSGGQVTGKIYLPSTATSTDVSHPTQLAYGLLGAYGTLKILANTDNAEGADNEYVHIAAARGLDPTTSQGITVYGTYANCFGKKISTEGHTHSYLPLSGGNLTGSISLTTDNTGITGVCGGGTDQWTIVGGGTNDNGYLEIRTRDNGNEPIYVRQYDANGLVRTAALLDGNGATSFPGLISEGGTKLTDKYAAKSHGHNEIYVKDAPFNSSNDTTSNWGGQGVSVSWYPDGTTITNKPNSWGFIFNIGRGTEVHQMWFSQATGTTYHRGGNGSGWSGSWRAMLDSDNFSSYAAPASHSHSYLSTGGGTLSGPVQVSGESKFHNGTYSDPWNGTACAIKATGNIAATGIIKANGRMDIQGIPLSIQSGAPSCGGVWIQI